YPRKYAQWRVQGRDIVASYQPNSDTLEYWAHSKDITPPPEFNFERMKQQALASTAYVGGSTYVVLVSTVINSLILTANTTWFFEGDVTIQGPAFIRGLVIVKGNLTIDESAV